MNIKLNVLLSTLVGIIMFFCFILTVEAQTKVRGYYKSNGTYVQPYVRSSSDSSVYNNYSTKGNYNPYTGKKGYKNPYSVRKYRYRSY